MQSTNFMSEDIFGQALLDFQTDSYAEDIVTYSSLEEKDVMPLSYLFRDHSEMPFLEKVALKNCYGKVLDIGCGAGNHSLYLQQNGFDATALDTSIGAIEVCKRRGVKKTIHSDIYGYSNEKFDTLLLLMNGIGLVGHLGGLNQFLVHAKTLLKPEGFIVLDSSDIIYMYETKDGHYDISNCSAYYGEIEFTMEYKQKRSMPFKWLYIDFATLNDQAIENGYECQMLVQGEHFDYLAKLSPKL